MYIKKMSYISCQTTFDLSFFDKDSIDYDSIFVNAIEPDYGNTIPKGLLRRMGKGVRMGIGSGMQLIQNCELISGIIIGTANGGLEDCVKFLNQIVDFQEGTLTPTNFVQSTPNALAANLAMMTQNSCYNTTHVNSGLAFESAIMDALLTLNEVDGDILLGSTEEVTQANVNIDKLKGWVVDSETKLSELIHKHQAGSVISEGAGMFVVSQDNTDALAKLVDVLTITTEDFLKIGSILDDFLKEHRIDNHDLAFVLGRNGHGEHNNNYDEFEKRFVRDQPLFSYKNLCGEFPTSISFALWLSINILNNSISNESIIRNVNKVSCVKAILIYNQTFNNQHSFLLLKRIL
jgi:hypothetical protein